MPKTFSYQLTSPSWMYFILRVCVQWWRGWLWKHSSVSFQQYIFTIKNKQLSNTLPKTVWSITVETSSNEYCTSESSESQSVDVCVVAIKPFSYAWLYHFYSLVLVFQCWHLLCFSNRLSDPRENSEEQVWYEIALLKCVYGWLSLLKSSFQCLSKRSQWFFVLFFILQSKWKWRQDS